jgi:predicted AlkP superfamily pyrophosphatase or phosphodiesterase
MKTIYKTLLKVLLIITIIFYPLILFGYIGPGAGFAFFGSFTALLIAVFLLIFSIISLPIRILINIFKKKKREYTPLTKKVIIIGMDGLDPVILRKFIKNGKLPNFKKMIELGDFKNLKTTTPALSPVAWSTFQT